MLVVVVTTILWGRGVVFEWVMVCIGLVNLNKVLKSL